MFALENNGKKRDLRETGLEYSILLISIVILSCTYDYFYYWRLKIDLLKIPTTLYDHYKSSLKCFPYLIACMLVLFLYELFSKDKNIKEIEREGIMLEYHLSSEGKKQELSRKNYYKKTGFFMILFNSFISIYVDILEYEKLLIEFYTFISVLINVSLFLGFYYLFFYEKLIKKFIFSPNRLKFISKIFLIIIFFASCGYHTARLELYKIYNHIENEVAYAKNGEMIPVGILRSIEKGIIVLNKKTKLVEFSPWEDVKKIIYDKPDPFEEIDVVKFVKENY